MATPVLVEVLTASGCNRCRQTKDLVRRLVDEWPECRFEYREINVVAEIDYAVSLGVLSTPAVVIGGELIFTAPPSEKKLRQALLACLQATSSEEKHV